MAVIDFVKWDAAPNVYAWKYPSQELSSWTQLIVHESQEAVMFREGRAIGPFKAGRHVLSADNYPLLNQVLKIPFGESPYTAEVWFVRKNFQLNVKWGTSTPIQLEDPRYRIMLPVRAFGQYGLTVENALKFLIKMVGTMPAFTEKTLTDHFRGIIITAAKDHIAKYLIEKKVSILQISAHLLEISQYLETLYQQEMEEFGLRLVKFRVDSISTNDEDPAVIKLKEALAKRAEMEILGFNYQQARSFDTMQAAAENQGANGIMGVGMGMGMGFGMGMPMGNVMGQMAQNLAINGKVCPQCGNRNDPHARFCATCAAELFTAPVGTVNQNITCPRCQRISPQGTKFCPNCGQQLSSIEEK